MINVPALSFLYPQGYSHWLEARLPGRIREGLATCDLCAMTAPKGITRDPGPFLPTLKCCTSFPFMPNFGLGGLLKSGSIPAALRLRTAAAQGLLLPSGLFASPERETEISKQAFGQVEALLCPFFDKAVLGCSVWLNRPGVCATYYCKSEREQEGLEFWADVESYLNHFEWVVANEVLLRLEYDQRLETYSEAIMLAEPGEEREFLLRSAWGAWYQKQDSFFILCLQEALKLTQNELTRLLGDEALSLEESLNKRT